MKKFNVTVFSSGIIIILLLCGCVEKEKGEEENIIEISAGTDDGGVSILTDLLPNNFGMVMGSGDIPVMVGLFTSGGGDNLTGRAIYRFNLSEWKGGNITFHVKCIQKYGSPGNVDIYVSHDLGTLPSYPSEIEDVSYLWNLSDGMLISTYTPQADKWMEVLIPSDKINAILTDDYLTIVIKLEDENIGSNSDYYVFSTSEYNHGASKPYLTEI